MADSFLYQPHVHGADGVLTPDLVVDALALAAATEPLQIQPLPINLLASATTLQQTGETACGSAALVVVAAGRGAIVAVGADHWDPALEDGTALAHQTCAKPIGREAMRLADADTGIVLRTFQIRNGGETLIGETALGDLPLLPEVIAAWSGGPEPPPRSALFISAGHRDGAARSADGYRVELDISRTGMRLQCAYRVHRL